MNHLTMKDVLRLKQSLGNASDTASVTQYSAGTPSMEPLLDPESIAVAQSILRLVPGAARREMAAKFMACWAETSKDWLTGDDTNYCEGKSMLGSLGASLTRVLGEETASGLGATTRSVPLPPPGTLNRSDGLIATIRSNEVPESSIDLTQRSKPAGSAADEGRGRTSAQQCVFASCTAGQGEVIRVVLSLYVRRGRLPEPGEVLFCSSSTTKEDLELVVRRFADRRKRDQEFGLTSTSGIDTSAVGNIGGIFTIADVHNLDYSSQAVLLAHLRSKVLELNQTYSGDAGVDGRVGGAVLMIVSGEPRQAILSWLSDHVMELAPLPIDTLREAVAFDLDRHYGGEMMMLSPELKL